MKIDLHARPSRRKPLTDTITLLNQLGWRSVGPGHWSDGKGGEIIERRIGDNPWLLKFHGEEIELPALSEIYREIVRRIAPPEATKL